MESSSEDYESKKDDKRKRDEFNLKKKLLCVLDKFNFKKSLYNRSFLSCNNDFTQIILTFYVLPRCYFILDLIFVYFYEV